MKKRVITVILLLSGVLLLVVAAALSYREWSPITQQAATIYYISPNGNDTSGNGTNNSPWKTITKANSAISPGDTVILKDGVYSGYFSITKANTTWKAENKQKAIIDGGFGPSMLQGNWNNIVSAWDTTCSKQGMWTPLLGISNTSNVTVDGLFLRNSCGRGIGVFASGSGRSDNVLIKNSRIDWTFVAGVFARPEANTANFPDQIKNFQFIDNIVTRSSFNDQYNIRTGDKKYSVNITTLFGGTNPVVRGNIIAWGRGEVTGDVSKGLLFENNTVVGNKNDLYLNLVSNATIRNNLFFAPEEGRTTSSQHMVSTGQDPQSWHLGIRNEEGIAKTFNVPYNTNISYYNNLFINVDMGIDCYNRVTFPSNNSQIYFGNNTFVSSKTQPRLLRINCAKSTGSPSDPVLTGIFENNIIDARKNPGVIINVSVSANDQFTFRNNLWPTNVTTNVKGSGDVYTNNPDLNNSLAEIKLQPPTIGATSIDINALLSAVDVNNYRLNQTSPAINKATTAGSANNTAIPQLARSQDYFKANRIGIPDIGAIEYGGIQTTQSPNPSNTVIPTDSITPTNITTPINTTVPQTPTSTRVPNTSVPSATSPQGNICGKGDIDGNGIFTIGDFTGFAQAYGNGKNTCADKEVNYGACGGRDVNRDGSLNIFDFGAPGVGFAQRYYPRTSCAL